MYCGSYHSSLYSFVCSCSRCCESDFRVDSVWALEALWNVCQRTVAAAAACLCFLHDVWIRIRRPHWLHSLNTWNACVVVCRVSGVEQSCPLPHYATWSRTWHVCEPLVLTRRPHLFNGHLSGTAWVAWYRNVFILDFIGAKDDEGAGDNWRAPVISSPQTN